MHRVSDGKLLPHPIQALGLLFGGQYRARILVHEAINHPQQLLGCGKLLRNNLEKQREKLNSREFGSY